MNSTIKKVNKSISNKPRSILLNYILVIILEGILSAAVVTLMTIGINKYVDLCLELDPSFANDAYSIAGISISIFLSLLVCTIVAFSTTVEPLINKNLAKLVINFKIVYAFDLGSLAIQGMLMFTLCLFDMFFIARKGIITTSLTLIVYSFTFMVFLIIYFTKKEAGQTKIKLRSQGIEIKRKKKSYIPEKYLKCDYTFVLADYLKEVANDETALFKWSFEVELIERYKTALLYKNTNEISKIHNCIKQYINVITDKKYFNCIEDIRKITLFIIYFYKIMKDELAKKMINIYLKETLAYLTEKIMQLDFEERMRDYFFFQKISKQELIDIVKNKKDLNNFLRYLFIVGYFVNALSALWSQLEEINKRNKNLCKKIADRNEKFLKDSLNSLTCLSTIIKELQFCL